jgi:hypothetical protein
MLTDTLWTSNSPPFNADNSAETSLAEYVKTMQIDREIIDLSGQAEINEDLLDPNAIPPERESQWPDPDDQDPDCQIIEDPRPERPLPSPPLGEDWDNDTTGPTAQPTKMEVLLLSTTSLRQL